MIRRALAGMAGNAISLFARVVTAVRGVWQGIEPVQKQRIYFANHGSNGDFVLIWTVLPPALRRQTRPVAGSDYWLFDGMIAVEGGRRIRRPVLE